MIAMFDDPFIARNSDRIKEMIRSGRPEFTLDGRGFRISLIRDENASYFYDTIASRGFPKIKHASDLFEKITLEELVHRRVYADFLNIYYRGDQPDNNGPFVSFMVKLDSGTILSMDELHGLMHDSKGSYSMLPNRIYFEYPEDSLFLKHM